MLRSWLSALVAITMLRLLSSRSHSPLIAVPLGASTVLVFGHPESPLAQPCNLVAGNTLAALISVGCVLLFGKAPWVMGLAVGLTIAWGQVLRCLHPPRRSGGAAWGAARCQAELHGDA